MNTENMQIPTNSGHEELDPIAASLIWAATTGNLVELKLRLSQGAFPNTPLYDGRTALHMACLAGDLDCVNILLDAGASVHIQNIDGSTPLCEACISGSLLVVHTLLQRGAKVNPNLSFTSPLHEAVLKGHVEIAACLIKAGANLESNDLHFGSPLHVAAFKNNSPCTRLLLIAGANANAAKNHQTPLHLAALKNYVDIVALLLYFGARANMEDNCGRRPVDVSTSRAVQDILCKHMHSSPGSLLSISRFRVRHTVGANRLKHMALLPIPQTLIAHLYYKCEFPMEHHLCFNGSC